MRAGPVLRAAAGGLARRRVQTVVITLVVLVSTAASVLALGLVVDSSAPFDHAFAAQRGADVTAAISSARATPAQVAATTRLPQVTAAAGPFPEVTVSPQVQVTVPSGSHVELRQGPMTLVGRAGPGGPADDLALKSGHWPAAPGQVVLATGGAPPGQGIGSTITVTSAPGKPVLTVTGFATSVTGSADGWVLPAEVARLRAPGTPASEQMLYRFASAGTTAAIRSDIAAVTRALPAGAVAGTQSYLSAKLAESGNIAPFVPFLVAFGVLGMVMSVLIVGNVVSGAVVSGYRRIGVLKSIGFTPAQVVAAYTGQVTVLALGGCVAGAALGDVLAVPLLAQAAGAYGVGTLSVPVWVDVAVPAVMCALTAAAALVPALRAGRLSAVRAIATGRAPRTGRGYRAHRVLGRLRLPRPVTIGLAAPFARPARTALTLVAVGLGATAVTFAVGLNSSLALVGAGLSHSRSEQVRVTYLPGGHALVIPGQAGPARAAAHPHKGGTHPQQTVLAGQPSLSAAEQRSIQAALAAQPGTLHYVAQADQLVSVSGVSGQVMATAFRSSAAWTGYDLIHGHWYTGPDQVLVPAHFLTVTGKSIGDTITISAGGTRIPVRIVGEVFDTQNHGLAVITGWQTLASAEPHLAPSHYDVGLRPGTSAASYAHALEARLGQYYLATVNNHDSATITLMTVLIGTLTLLLAGVAALGVLNTVVLHTRERAHDLGVFKAVGMTPRQTVAMVVCWVAGTGLLAGIAAVPAGIAVHHAVLPAMAAAADVGLPASFLNVYGAGEIGALALAGAVIAVAGALAPAGWAAGIRTASALRAE